MNAVDPARTLPRLGPESRVLRRGVLGDRLDGRSREGRFLLQCERELLAQIGGKAKASFTQQMLIRRMSRALLRLELIDEQVMATGEISPHTARTFSALSNTVRLTARELGMKPVESTKALDLDAIIARNKGAAP